MRLATATLLLLVLGCAEAHTPPCTAGSICVIAGTGEMGETGDDGPALAAELSLPVDVTVGPDGLLYIVDMGNLRVRRIDEAGTIRTVLGSGVLGDVREGPALETDLNHVSQVVFASPTEMLAAAWHNSLVLRVDLARSEVEIVAGTGERDYRGDGGAATDAAFDLPSGLALLPGGELLVTDQANQVIRRIDAAGIVHRYAGHCVVGLCDADEMPSACPDNDKLLCEGPTSTCRSLCAAAFGGDGGPALDASLGLPNGAAASPAGRLVTAPDGSIYFADTWNDRVRHIDPSGVIETIAGSGEPGLGGDEGPATEAQLDSPSDVALGSDGTLYIADTHNSCVRAVSPGGTIRTVAGVCGTRGDGPAVGSPDTVLLDRPYGIEVAPDGRLYIADTGNHEIRVVMPPR